MAAEVFFGAVFMPALQPVGHVLEYRGDHSGGIEWFPPGAWQGRNGSASTRRLRSLRMSIKTSSLPGNA